LLCPCPRTSSGTRIRPSSTRSTGAHLFSYTNAGRHRRFPRPGARSSTYLQELGGNAIWLMPVSFLLRPCAMNGYEPYRLNTPPSTPATANLDGLHRRFLQAALTEARHTRNRRAGAQTSTSGQHPWIFQEVGAKSQVTIPKRDWYVLERHRNQVSGRSHLFSVGTRNSPKLGLATRCRWIS
jgi:hypothetical protein